MHPSPTSSASSSSSTRSSPVHQASLVDPATHSPALMELIDIKMSRSVIDYVVDCIVETVDYAMGRPSSSRGRSSVKRPENTKFTTFVTNVITRAEITTPVVLAALVYVDRAKPHLHIALEEWALERVFLGALIVASKYTNDSTLKNVHWALCTGVFGKRDVGRIEREFLDVLDFELGITEGDLLSHHDGLSAVTLTAHSHRYPRPTYTSHTQSRSHRHKSNVPDLEPSSPESSDGSSSPRTPSTLDSSPSFSPKKLSAHAEHSAPSQPQKKSTFQSTTLDLLRSFPIPIPPVAHHNHSHSHSNSHPSSQAHFPIHIVA